MNDIFDSLKRRFEKIADVYTDADRGVLLIRRDDALTIIEDVKDSYNQHLWHPLHWGVLPQSEYGESSKYVLVRYKDEEVAPAVCLFNFATKRFMFAGRDVTEFVKEWCEIPGSEC